MQVSASPQGRTDQFLHDLLMQNSNPLFREVLNNPGKYRLQIIYTEINRDRKNRPVFREYFFNHDQKLYFNPASMVKLPLAALALEKLNRLHKPGVNMNTAIHFLKSQPWQTGMETDSSSADNKASIAHFIKRALLISENDPYNRLYQFVGQQEINRQLHNKTYTKSRITRQFLGLSPEQNRHTNAIRFVNDQNEVLFEQPPAVNPDSFDFSRQVLLGNAHIRDGKKIEAPFDFTMHNSLPLLDMDLILRSIIFPQYVPPFLRFQLERGDYEFLRRYLSQYPSETPDPKYDEQVYYDSYVKFFFRDSSRKMPEDLRVFNKVGWSYGFITDVSYVADFKNKVEFMLSATIYVNSDGVVNDNKYDYDSIGYPFFYQLGQTVYQHELQRKRKHVPDLSDLRIKYEKRDEHDRREPLKDLDN